MWKIKDPELKAKVNAFFGDEEINNAFTKNTDCYRYFRLSTNINKSCFTFAIDKDLMEFIPDYDPDDWNPFPQIKPPAYCHWLVQFESGEIKVIEYVRQEFSSFSVGDFWNAPKLSKVIAFRKLPEPFQPKETK